MRRATGSDAPRLTEFYNRHFADRPRLNDTSLWKWKFAAQPDISNAFPFFVLDNSHSIEGGIGFVHLNLYIGTQIVAAVHPVNFFVNPGFKGLHALRLFRAAVNEAPIVLGSNISEAASPLVKRSGFVDFSAYYNAYYLPLQINRSETSTIRTFRFAILYLIRRIWISILDAAVLFRKPDVSYQVAETLNTSLLAQVSTWRMANCAIVKDANYISWRYASSPVLNCKYIWQMRGNKPIALAIMHLDLMRGEAVLLDCIAESTGLWTLVGLLTKSMYWARRSGAKYWITSTLSAPLERALRTLGCRWQQSSLGLSVLCSENSIRDVVTDYKNWHFMVGDTDMY